MKTTPPLILFTAIKSGQRLVWISTALGGLFIFVSLFWIVRRAATVIEQQQEQLVESETMVAIGEMLAYARPSYEKLQPLQMNGVIRTTLDTLTRQLKKQEIHLRCDLETPIPKIEGDIAPLRHLLICLMTNAMEAMPEGGTLSVKNDFMRNQGFVK